MCRLQEQQLKEKDRLIRELQEKLRAAEAVKRKANEDTGDGIHAQAAQEKRPRWSAQDIGRPAPDAHSVPHRTHGIRGTRGNEADCSGPPTHRVSIHERLQYGTKGGPTGGPIEGERADGGRADGWCADGGRADGGRESHQDRAHWCAPWMEFVAPVSTGSA
jgi:hypothetical protein